MVNPIAMENAMLDKTTAEQLGQLSGIAHWVLLQEDRHGCLHVWLLDSKEDGENGELTRKGTKNWWFFNGFECDLFFQDSQDRAFLVEQLDDEQLEDLLGGWDLVALVNL